MPNKRKKGKDQVNAWVPTHLKEELKRIAERDGLTLSDVVSKILNEQVEIHKRSKPDAN